MVPNLVESDSCRTGCSHWWSISEEELAVIRTSECPFSFAVPLSGKSIVDIGFKLGIQVATYYQSGQRILRINNLEVIMCWRIESINLRSISINRKELFIIGLLLLLLEWRHDSLVQYVLAIVLHLQMVSLLQLHPWRRICSCCIDELAILVLVNTILQLIYFFDILLLIWAILGILTLNDHL